MAVCEYYQWCPTRQYAFSDSKKRLEDNYCKNRDCSVECDTKAFLTEELSRSDSLANLEKSLKVQ